jgi:hypothetical protein
VGSPPARRRARPGREGCPRPRVPGGTRRARLNAGGDYGAEIDRLANGATVESAQVGDQFEREGKQVLARAGRARPPTALDTEHQELVRLLRAYVSAQRELYDAVAQRDPDRAVALADEYGRAAAELKPVVDALYARARA